MKVVVNDEAIEIEERATVARLLELRGLGSRPCAVEVNRGLVPRREHAGHELAEGDRVEIVTLVGGG